MIFPINFVAGAVVGAVSTYIYKDETAQQWVKDKTDLVTNMFKKKEEAEKVEETTTVDAAADVEQKADDVVEAEAAKA